MMILLILDQLLNHYLKISLTGCPTIKRQGIGAPLQGASYVSQIRALLSGDAFSV